MRTVWAMKNIDPVNVNPTGNLKGKTLFVSGASRGYVPAVRRGFLWLPPLTPLVVCVVA